jgi:hypothetical protein
MSGFKVEVADKRVIFTQNGRTVTTTDGTMVNLLPTPYEATINAVFPDVPKGKMYIHGWDLVARSPTTADGSEYARAHVTALPQEWSNTTVLTAVPPDVDFFAGRVRLNRTVSPSHPWIYNLSNFPPMVKTNEWITLTGSFLLEQTVGFARALSIYVDGSNLVMHQQQSIGNTPGGWGTWGPDGEPNTFSAAILSAMFPTHAEGGETIVMAGGQGWPLWYGGDTAPYFVSATYSAVGGYFNSTIPGANGFYTYAPGSPSFQQNFPAFMRLSSTVSATHASTNDPTNLSSTWQVEIHGRFGRRS